MRSFDEWYESKNFNSNSFDSDDEENWFKSNVKSGYEAGAQSRQSEVDELRKMIEKMIDNTIIAVDDDLENQARDLLKGENHES